MVADADFGAIHIDLHIYADTRHPVVRVILAANKALLLRVQQETYTLNSSIPL